MFHQRKGNSRGKVISIEKEFNPITGSYSLRKAFGKNKLSYGIDYSLLTFSYKSVAYSDEIIYKERFLENVITKKYISYATGSLIKNNGLKKKLFFLWKIKLLFLIMLFHLIVKLFIQKVGFALAK